jgi:ABC transporter substrate binding protein (PQQ-dependent alcohol dehydrogenase system)
MITRLAVLLALLTALPSPVFAAEAVTFDFAYLMRDGDPAYVQRRAYTGLTLRDRQRPVEGARLGVKDSKVIGRSLGLRFGLREEILAEETSSVERIEALAAEGVRVFLLDLPLADVIEAGRALAARDLLLFNIRHPDDTLRGAECAPVLFHTLPSQAMLMDGLAQFLFKKNWRKALVLEGEAPADKTLSTAFQAAARKFGLTVTDVRPFVLSNDPRQRDQTNLPILTSGGGYDVVFLADSLGEVGRYLPYNTMDPRPVVGSEGLVPDAWHWTWERHGAPQLNQRFDKLAGRRMTGEDWAAWAAVKVVVEAITRSKNWDVLTLRAFLRGGDLTFDTYKGLAGSFRPWDNQLRQPIQMHTDNAVIASAPLEGFLHQTNTLDSLGTDKPETDCQMP